MADRSNGRTRSPDTQAGITRLGISGFKSIAGDCELAIRPLTILAGANSSGKSSAIQPLLLLKQTLDVTYDPGPLLLDGANVRFTESSQLFSSIRHSNSEQAIRVRVGTDSSTLETAFRSPPDGRIEVFETSSTAGDTVRTVSIDKGVSESIKRSIPAEVKDLLKHLKYNPDAKWLVERDRCFLKAGVPIKMSNSTLYLFDPSTFVGREIRRVIHLPGLRGNPLRTYPVTAVKDVFPGTFETYAASVIAQWQDEKNQPKLRRVGKDLETIGLTWKVTAKHVSDTQVGLAVGRLTTPRRGGAHDLVSIADVGFGTSQALPIIVALNVATPGQVVYIEQPEIHLHPRSQQAIAIVLAAAAERGVRVIAETHSSLLLLAIQALVASGKLDRHLVQLHWFTRDADGCSRVSSANLDDNGAFGDWPEDFYSVAAEVESRFLDAIEDKHVADPK